MKRIRMLALLPAFCLLLAACGGAGGAQAAATMHLQRTEGSVEVSGAKGEEIAAEDGLGLYSGYELGTAAASYAWIDLDSAKLAKLDEGSRAAVQKEDRQLVLEVSAGSLFFNVPEPLAADESFEIRSSDLVAGVRGTCGWVEVQSGRMLVWLLKGEVECAAADKTATLHPGEVAVLSIADGAGSIELRPFEPGEIPGFVRGELTGALADEAAALWEGGLTGTPAEAGQGSASGAPAAADLAGQLESLRQNAVSYEDQLVIQIGGGGAPTDLEPAGAFGFINGLLLDVNGDGAEELISVTSASSRSLEIAVQTQDGHKSTYEGGFYGTAEYGGGGSRLDTVLFQNPVSGGWCAGFCNTIESDWFHVLDISLFSIDQNGGLVYQDSWYWDDVSDADRAGLPGLQAELEAAGWPYLDTGFLSFGSRPGPEGYYLLSRAEVTKADTDRYLHIYSPEELAAS